MRTGALTGWAAEDHAEAARLVSETLGPEAARHLLEGRLRPGPPAEGLVTGYFEPEAEGALRPGGRYRWPLLAPPPEAAAAPMPDRAAIEAGALAGRGLELAWLADPAEAYLIQVQGSGRVLLAEGGVLRLGFAARNGHPYRSLGRHLVATGALSEAAVSAETVAAAIRAAADPRQLTALNPSYVFFRALQGDSEDGPLGTAGRPLVALRSIAVDPAWLPLGSAVWVETETVDGPLARLMRADDTGSAIRGPGRADIFFGRGAEARRRAGRQNARGRLTPLLPP
jgi:membrane-bound lytic murein transglycosylase A